MGFICWKREKETASNWDHLSLPKPLAWNGKKKHITMACGNFLKLRASWISQRDLGMEEIMINWVPLHEHWAGIVTNLLNTNIYIYIFNSGSCNRSMFRLLYVIIYFLLVCCLVGWCQGLVWKNKFFKKLSTNNSKRKTLLTFMISESHVGPPDRPHGSDLLQWGDDQTYKIA